MPCRRLRAHERSQLNFKIDNAFHIYHAIFHQGFWAAIFRDHAETQFLARFNLIDAGIFLQITPHPEISFFLQVCTAAGHNLDQCPLSDTGWMCLRHATVVPHHVQQAGARRVVRQISSKNSDLAPGAQSFSPHCEVARWAFPGANRGRHSRHRDGTQGLRHPVPRSSAPPTGRGFKVVTKLVELGRP